MVTQGDRPAIASCELIDGIRSRENADGIVSLGQVIDFSTGDQVRVLAGPMCDQVGIFDCKSDRDRVSVLLNLLGRQVRVKLPVTAISAAI